MRRLHTAARRGRVRDEDRVPRGGRAAERRGGTAREESPDVAVLELYLIRHGIAAERGAEYPDDSKRPLTGRGASSFRRAAKALNTLGVRIDVIITSPLVRCRQTAEILAATLSSKPTVTASDALAPAGTPAAVIQEIIRHARGDRVALVGHEPNVGELAARLMASRGPIPFKKGAICRMDFTVLPPKGVGELRWFLPPRVLRKVGG